MLFYELTNIEVYIRQLAEGKKGGNFIDLRKEEQRILFAFRKHVLRCNDECILTRYIALHQQSIGDLLDTLGASPIKKTKTMLEAEETLKDILSFLETHFTDYFDFNCAIPKCWLDRVRSEITVEVESLNLVLSPDTSGLGSLVVEILIDSISKNEAVTFRKVRYINSLVQELVRVEHSFSIEILTQDICQILIRLNFNAERFYEFYVNKINDALIKCESLSEKIDQLAYFHKSLSQEHCPQKLSFCPDCAPISIQLLEWISYELEYCRNKQLLQLSPMSKTEGLSNDFKLSFDLSVSHLAYLFKSLIETGVVQNKNTSELIRFLTNS
jgi:hypothetical protein